MNNETLTPETTTNPQPVKKRGRPRKNPLIPQVSTEPKQTDPQVSSPAIPNKPVPAVTLVEPAGSVTCYSIRVEDVAQVTSPNSIYYGGLFVVGGVDDTYAHGFMVLESGRKEYITVELVHLSFIGRSIVRSRQPCSQQWMSDHGISLNDQTNHTPIQAIRSR